MRVIIGSDHGGFKLKEQIKKHLESKDIEIEDMGTDTEEPVDYPDFAAKVAERVQDSGDFGIIFCGTGIGVSITANKFRNIRAALCYDEYTARMAREHNNANILCLGGRTTKYKDATKIVDVFLDTKHSQGARHQIRVKKIDEIEKNNFK